MRGPVGRMASQVRQVHRGLLLAGLVWASAGCANLGAGPAGTSSAAAEPGSSLLGQLAYYAQSVNGHLSLLQQARPVADWLTDAQTPAALGERLLQAQRLRQFAVQQLGLPDNASYTRYADLGRPAVVWNVVAAPELSLAPKTWCFVMMGCVAYRGYFDRAQADALAGWLTAQGWEVSVYGVPAYSTLGWTNWLGGDPLLNTFVGRGEAYLARLVFHELAHQVVYVADDTMFNESYATAVERLGLARWQAATGGAAEDPGQARRQSEFKALTLRTREALQALYASGLPPAQQRQRKAELMQALRDAHAALKAGPWTGYSGYDGWIARANNATLALQAAYDGLVPAFERLHQQQGGDFVRFHAEVKRLAALPRAERRALLAALQADAPIATAGQN